MGVLIDSDTEAIDQLTTEPGGPAAEGDGEHLDDEGAGAGSVVGIVHTYQPADQEQYEHDAVGRAVQQADPLGPGAGRDGGPVQQPGHRGEDGADHSGRDIPVADLV